MKNEVSIEQQLRDFEHHATENWQALIFNLRKHFDIWSHQYLKERWKDMKLSYLPVMFNVSIDGSSASEIARRSNLPKQTVSRTIKELEEKGYILSNTSANDKRVEILFFTELGKSFIFDAKEVTRRVNSVYVKLVGKEHLKIAADVINKLIAHYESDPKDIFDTINMG